MYRHDKDAATLRAVLLTLTKQGGLNQKALLKELDDAPDSKTKTSMSLPTFRRFIKGVGNSVKIDELEWIWEFLRSHAKYHVYFGSNVLASKAEPPPADRSAAENDSQQDQLSRALANFFCEQKGVKHLRAIEDIKDSLPGQYVMYRYDSRRATANLPFDGSIQVSFVEISASNTGLSIRETNDFSSEMWRQSGAGQ